MGAFHEGHLSLMRQAKNESDCLVVSLFVNPTQFGPNEDFTLYPRDERRDAALAKSAGVDILFAPSDGEIYPRKTTIVSVKDVSDRWEGAHRPGHFEGVATVVCKLFNIVQPDRAYFGLKDLQQCAVIRRMVEDLDIPVTLQFFPTVREADGLALSSRNAYLNAEERAKAPRLFEVLSTAAGKFRLSGVRLTEVAEELEKGRANLEAEGFKVDYLAVVDTMVLQPKDFPAKGDSIIVAARIGETRLIDNIQI